MGKKTITRDDFLSPMISGAPGCGDAWLPTGETVLHECRGGHTGLAHKIKAKSPLDWGSWICEVCWRHR